MSRERTKTGSTSPDAHPVLVDAHVHFHACFDPAVFLGAAARNFARAARDLGIAGRFACVVCLTESAGRNWFAELTGSSAPDRDWRVVPTLEPDSLHLQGPEGASLFVIAGRQIVTRERIEVLALATTRQIPDGQEASPTVAAVRQAGGLAVLPWAFGKWTGRRGVLVRSLVTKPESRELFVGDNGSRPALLPRPRMLRLAESNGLSDLPGSDPLPMPRHQHRAGSFGCALRVDRWQPERPASSLRDALKAPCADLRPFGRLRPTLSFLRDQVEGRLS